MIAERAAMPQDLTKGSEYLMLSSKISSALCSMTDIYLTDCWYAALLHALSSLSTSKWNNWLSGYKGSYEIGVGDKQNEIDMGIFDFRIQGRQTRSHRGRMNKQTGLGRL